MEACKILAHLLLERRNKGRGAASSSSRHQAKGRLYRSEPAINALGHDSLQRPLNNARPRG